MPGFQVRVVAAGRVQPNVARVVHRFFWVACLMLVAAAQAHGADGRRPEKLGSGVRSPLARVLFSAAPSVPDLSSIRLRHIRYAPSAKLGYQRVGMSLSMPIPLKVSVEGGEPFSPESIRLTLPDADLWIGEAGVEATLVPSLRLYTNASGNIIQYLVASASGAGSTNDAWHRHPVLWMEAESGIRYFPWETLGIVTGLRWDYFDLTVKKPDPLKTVQVGQYKNVALLPSDVESRLWIPYVGVQAVGSRFTTSLIASPFAAAWVKARTRLRADVTQSYQFLAESVITLRSLALFAEARIEYRLPLSTSANLKIWGKGGWLSAKGGGRLQSAYAATLPGLHVEVLDDRSIAFDRYNLAGGLSAGVSF